MAKYCIGWKDLIRVSETWGQQKVMKSLWNLFICSFLFLYLPIPSEVFFNSFIQWNSPYCNSLFCQDSLTKDYDYSSQSEVCIHGDSALNFGYFRKCWFYVSVCAIFLLLIYFINALVQIYLFPSHTYKAVPVTSYKRRHHNAEEKH